MNITDVEAPVIKEMLKFLYSGCYSDDYEIAEDLLIAADKYRWGVRRNSLYLLSSVSRFLGWTI